VSHYELRKKNRENGEEEKETLYFYNLILTRKGGTVGREIINQKAPYVLNKRSKNEDLAQRFAVGDGDLF